MRFSRWIDRVISDAEADGWIITFSGRCIVIPKKEAPEKSSQMLKHIENKASVRTDNQS